MSFAAESVRQGSQNPKDSIHSNQLLIPHQFAKSRVSISERRKSFGEFQAQLEVTVLRAHNLPRLRTTFNRTRFFYVSVSDGITTRKTTALRGIEQAVEWNENLGTFTVSTPPQVKVCLYAMYSVGKDYLVGSYTVSPESQDDMRITLGQGQDASSRPTILHLVTTLTDTGDSGSTSNLGKSKSGEDDDLVSLRRDEPSETATMKLIKKATLDISGARLAIDHISASHACRNIISRIQSVMDVVQPFAEVHTFAQLAFKLLSIIPNALSSQFERDENIQALLIAIYEAFDFVQDTHVLRDLKPKSKQTEVLILMLRSVCDSSRFIQSYTKDTDFAKRFLKHINRKVDEQITEYCNALERLRYSFLGHAAITTEVAVLQTQVDLKLLFERFADKELDAIVREIPYGVGTRYNPDKGCLDGTRTEFLDYISDWVNEPSAERGLIVLGQAGTGKSSIAHEIAHRFDRMHLLTTSFVFLRREQSKRKPYHLFTTMARDLADRDPSFKAALGKAIKDDTSRRVGARDYRTLFESLLLRPLKNVTMNGPVLVVVDALDESGDTIGSSGLHTFLAHRLAELPSNFRFLITSRPEHAIEQTFACSKTVRIVHMNDPALAASTNSDIQRFFQKELSHDMFQKYGDALTEKAEGLFQWAAVASGYIKHPPIAYTKNSCIRSLLKDSAGQVELDPLHNLYLEVLEGYFTTGYSRRRFQSVMGLIFAVSEPLCVSCLTALRQCAPVEDADDDEFIHAVVGHLGALLTNTTMADSSLPIVSIHTSFRDFLTEPRKSGHFYIDLEEAHHELAYSCLALMVRDLKFNICGLETSYIANNDLDELQASISENISPALSYACRYWDDHLKNTAFDNDLFSLLQTLITSKFLFWLEVLSLTNSVHLASPALSSLQGWLASASGNENHITGFHTFKEIVLDSSAFVRYFGMAIAKSTPHIYVSALPFTPTSSYVSKTYAARYQNTLSIQCGRVTHWPAVEMVLSLNGISTRSVAFSPDGQHIVSGSDDSTIRIWNAATGELEGVPISGHDDWVMSVALSPDGQRIVSGSDDGMVCIWNMETGEVDGTPFIGHTGSVLSVDFSPDGRYIVSGSHDCTIRIWDIAKGILVADPCVGHTGRINSVSFSSDGRYIVSGSDDYTIRLWDAITGTLIGRPFKGHSNFVNSVAFSPHGKRIASGSSDHGIAVWSTQGKLRNYIRGHTASVLSVKFSPDGRRILSGSSDGTVRVWNSRTGETEGGPFIGHTDWVMSVSFSPDGQRLISSSSDGTIRVWNAAPLSKERKVEERVVKDGGSMPESLSTTAGVFSVKSVAFSPDGQHIASGYTDHMIRIWNVASGEIEGLPLSGHTDYVNSVTFSPDGLRIASGSDDHTIRLWDFRSGEMIGQPLRGHTGSVMSVAFSPDDRFIASGSNDHTIRLWDPRTGEALGQPLIGHTDFVKSIAISPDAQLIASGSADDTVRIWDVTTGTMKGDIFSGHSRTVSSVAFSPDGRKIVSGSSDGLIIVICAATGTIEAGPFYSHFNMVIPTYFSADIPPDSPGSPGCDGQLVRLPSAATGDTLTSPLGPTTGYVWLIKSVGFSPDGQQILSSLSDGTVTVLNAATGQLEIGPLTGHTASINSAEFSPDGKFIVTGSRDGTVRLWSTITLISNQDTKEGVKFTDDCTISTDGWLVGSEGELLLWIPDLNRQCLHRPSTVWIAGGHETRLDLSRFVHGLDWVSCVTAT